MQQTRDASSTVYDGEGFRSNLSSRGNFLFQFEAPGTYYYSSGEVDPHGVIILKSKPFCSLLITFCIFIALIYSFKPYRKQYGALNTQLFLKVTVSSHPIQIILHKNLLTIATSKLHTNYQVINVAE